MAADIEAMVKSVEQLVHSYRILPVSQEDIRREVEPFNKTVYVDYEKGLMTASEVQSMFISQIQNMLSE